MTPRDFALYELDSKRLPGWAQDLSPRASRFSRDPKGSASPRDPKHSSSSRKQTRRADTPPTDPRDLALAEQITVGVTKNLLLLRHLIQHYSGRSLKSIDTLVQKILAIGLYQLRFLTRIPASAAVDQSVEQAKHFGRTRAAGFINAILRKAASQPEAPLPLPPRENAIEFATVVLSHPPDLFTRLARLSNPEDALSFCEHDQLEPPTIIRLSPGIKAADLAADGLTLTPHNRPGMLVVTGARRAILCDWASRGLAHVQDPTAASVVPYAKLEPGHVVLDRCAGLGTKTIQMRQAIGETGQVFAIDPSEPRCTGLRDLAAARQFTNISVHCTAWLRELADQPDFPRAFDRAIVDVPCSNSGVLARRPEARYHQSEKNLKSLIELQDKILDDTAPFIKPAGLLLYSTCSVWPEENQDRILAFAQRHPEFEVQEVQTTLPSFTAEPNRYHDGGYVAVLKRNNA